MTGSSPAPSDVGSAAASCVWLVAMVAVGSRVMERWAGAPRCCSGSSAWPCSWRCSPCPRTSPSRSSSRCPRPPCGQRGAGLAVGASRIGAILGVFVFPSLIEAWGLHRAPWRFVLVAAIVLAVCLAFAPETKGRVLEDITEPETLSAEPAGGARG